MCVKMNEEIVFKGARTIKTKVGCLVTHLKLNISGGREKKMNIFLLKINTFRK